MSKGPQNESIYTGFAEGYDRVMRDVDFEAWAIHVIELIDLHGLSRDRLLNAACGTGLAEPTWEKEGFRVTGFDQSDEMVEVARKRAGPKSKNRFLVSDMRTFDLGERFDVVTCLYDSLNYLTEPEEVQAFFERAFAHLDPGGGFIFDVATEANIIDNFSSTTYAENFSDFAYIWDNEYNLKTKICKSDFAFFYSRGDSSEFLRRCETHYQRMYRTSDLTKWVRQAGFKLLANYDGFSTRSPTPKSDRIHFVAQKP